MSGYFSNFALSRSAEPISFSVACLVCLFHQLHIQDYHVVPRFSQLLSQTPRNPINWRRSGFKTLPAAAAVLNLSMTVCFIRFISHMTHKNKFRAGSRTIQYLDDLHYVYKQCEYAVRFPGRWVPTLASLSLQCLGFHHERLPLWQLQRWQLLTQISSLISTINT